MSERTQLTATLARRLRRARERAKLTQYELAARTGLTRPKIKRIEKAEITTVSSADLELLERELGLSKASGRPEAAANGRPRRSAKSGRTRVDAAPADPELSRAGEDEVRRRVQESVLEVMRDLIGESGRVLVEKHRLHDVTLGRLFQVDA